MEWNTSRNDGVLEQGVAAAEQAVLAWVMASWTLVFWQGQHWGSSQADFSHCNSHLGRAQLVGLMHFWKQVSSSQTGEHLGSGASQVVWQ